MISFYHARARYTLPQVNDHTQSVEMHRARERFLFGASPRHHQ
jgi:hypothetical protein